MYVTDWQKCFMPRLIIMGIIPLKKKNVNESFHNISVTPTKLWWEWMWAKWWWRIYLWNPPIRSSPQHDFPPSTEVNHLAPWEATGHLMLTRTLTILLVRSQTNLLPPDVAYHNINERWHSDNHKCVWFVLHNVLDTKKKINHFSI